MGFKKVTFGTNYIIIIVLLAGILAIINAFSHRYFFRVDLTEDKKFTISDSTRKVLSDLDDIVNIKVYLSKKLPPYMVTIVDQIKDLLDEYSIYADGNIEIEYIDPAENPAVQQKLRFMGIPQLRLQIFEKDQAAVTNVYMGLAVLYGDNKEVIQALTDLATLEYDLTSKILRVTRSEVKTIGFLSGHEELGLQTELGTIDTELKEQYFTRTVETAKGEKIADDIAVLVVASPKKLSERDLFEIDQYIMSGGKAVFLVDAVAIEERGLRGIPVNSPITGLLEHYGVKVPTELVLDRLNANASFQSGPYTVFVPYPFWVRVVWQDPDSAHPITNHLESMVLPWAGPLEIDEERTKGKTVAVLARSSENSWTQQGFFDLNPQQNIMPPVDQLKQRIMAVAVSGKFTSFFADKSIPPVEKEQEPEEDKDTDPSEEQASADEERSILKESPETKIIVVGNSRFISSNFPVQFDGNRAFFLNAIDWFTLGDYLINIRSREAGERPLQMVSDRAKTVIRAVNMLGVPVLLAIFGLIVLYLRRRRKRLGIVLK